jgi:hypothetical protein
VGTSHYKNYTTSLEEYIENVHKKNGDVEVFSLIEQPVYINNNAYFNGAEPFELEKNKLVEEESNLEFSIIEEGEDVYLSCNLPESFSSIQGPIHSTTTLARVRIADAEFENPDGSEVILNTDFLDREKEEESALGPIALLKKGKNYIKVW